MSGLRALAESATAARGLGLSDMPSGVFVGSDFLPGLRWIRSDARGWLRLAVCARGEACEPRLAADPVSATCVLE